jgi:hypothetical protein
VVVSGDRSWRVCRKRCAVAGVVLACCSLGWWAVTRPRAVPDCLPTAAGDTVASLVETGAFASLAPPSWDLLSADIDRTRLVLTFGVAGSTNVGLELLPAPLLTGSAPATRWFFLRPFSSGGAPLALESRAALLRVGTRIDQAFARSPWVPCAKDPFRYEDPRWRTAGEGALAVLLFLVVGRWLVRRREHFASAKARGTALLRKVWVGGSSRARQLAVRIYDWREPLSTWLLLGILLTLLAVLLKDLDIPFDDDRPTQRLFAASLTWRDVLAHRYWDTRHPQLFFLILHPLVSLGGAEWVARLPAVVFALTSVAALFVLARSLLDGPRAALAAGLLACSPCLLEQGRRVGNWTLFLTLAILSSHYLLRALASPTRRRLTLYVLTTVAMLYASYMAAAIWAAHALVLVCHDRRRQCMGLWCAAGLALLLGLPALADLVVAGAQGPIFRSLSDSYSQHLGREGELGPWALGRDVVRLQLARGSAGWLGGALLLLGAYRWTRARRGREARTLFLGLVLATLAMCSTAAWQALRPYHFVFLLPVFAVLTVAGGLGLAPREAAFSTLRAAGRVLGGVALAAVLMGAGRQAADHLTDLYDRTQRGDYVALGEEIKAAGGADLVVTMPDSPFTLVLYHAYTDAAAVFRSCVLGADEAIRCALRGQQLVAFPLYESLGPEAGPSAIERLHALAETSYWFVGGGAFVTPEVKAFVAANCRLQGAWPSVRLHRCGRVEP